MRWIAAASPGRAVLMAFSTCPDEASAGRIAEALVSEGLAACVNRLPGVRSTYFWDGRLQDERGDSVNNQDYRRATA